VIDPLTETLDLAPQWRAPRLERSIVFESGALPWGIDAVLRLRAAHPTIRLLAPARNTQAERLVDAFRSGADAYIVGGGNPDTDRTLIDEIAEGHQIYRPAATPGSPDSPHREESGQPVRHELGHVRVFPAEGEGPNRNAATE